MNYGKKMKEIRTYDLNTQKDIANILNIYKGTYCLYETQQKIIPIKHLNSFCNYFNVSIDYIFGFSEKVDYNNLKKEINKKLSGERLKSFRKENKITQDNLAKTLNISRTTIAEYELGVNIIATPFLYEFCKKYKISADYLLGKTDNPKFFNQL